MNPLARALFDPVVRFLVVPEKVYACMGGFACQCHPQRQRPHGRRCPCGGWFALVIFAGRV
jgi:hypothetical protein